MNPRELFFRDLSKVLVVGVILVGLILASLYSYLLFHTVIELLSIVIAGAIFILAWNFRRFYADSFLIFIGTAFLFSGVIDLAHTLSYPGLGIFQEYDANLSVQLWLAARYLQGFSLLVAPLFLKRNVNLVGLVTVFSGLTGGLLLVIFIWDPFPIAYIDGQGLTPFKILSEYAIILLLVAAALFLWRSRPLLDRRVLRWLLLAIGIMAVSEFSLTVYIYMDGLFSMLGHMGRAGAYYLVYKAVIETEAGAIYANMAQLQSTQKALRSSEHTLKLFIEYAPTAIAMLDCDMRYIAFSRRYLLDYRIKDPDIRGRSHYEIFPEIPERWKEIHRRCLAGAVEKADEDPFPREDGSLDWVRWEIHPWYLSPGEMGGIIIFSEVITERKKAEEELARAHQSLQIYTARLRNSNQELEQFAFIASHDLQEPLRKIKMFSRRLENQIRKTAAIKEETGVALDSLQRMQKATERMQAMIDGLLELARVNTRGGKFEAVQLNGVVEEVVADLEVRLQASRGQVVSGELYSAEVDVIQIRRLFQNLIGNGLKFHRPEVPPVVEISAALTPGPDASCQDGSVTITVKDNGIGFAEQDAGQIFQPFQRLHGKSEFEGTGLGLSICQKIVQRHHGSIEAHGQPGAGATFIIILPCKQPG